MIASPGLGLGGRVGRSPYRDPAFAVEKIGDIEKNLPGLLPRKVFLFKFNVLKFLF
jgi:hypothetical protein